MEAVIILRTDPVKVSHLLKTTLATSLLTVAQASAADTLTVYTYDSFASDWGPGPAIEKAFEAKCGCDLQFVALDDGVSILNRLRLEGSSSKADVILGLDNNLISEAKASGLLAQHQVNTQALTLPGGWNDSVFVPFDYGYFAFVYNKEKLSNPPKSLKQLVEQRDDIKVIYQDPRTSTPGQGLLLWMKSVYGDHASQAWQQMAKKTVTVTKGWSEAYSMFLNGEADMVLSYTLLRPITSSLKKISVLPQPALKRGITPKWKWWQKWLRASQIRSRMSLCSFVVSEEFQSQIPTGNWMYPVVDTALPSGFEQLSVPSTALSFNSDEVAKHRKTWIREWQSALIK